MNFKTNRTLFIFIAILGSVKVAHANSNQLAIKSPHVRNTIKEAKTFESPNPFAVLGKMNSDPGGSSSLSNTHSINRLANKRSSHKKKRRETRSRLTIEADVTETKSNESKWSIPSINAIQKKELFCLAALKLLKGVQGASFECEGAEKYQCYLYGIMDSDAEGQYHYNQAFNEGFGYSTLISLVSAGSIALGMVGCCLVYRHQLKKNRSRRTEKDILLGSVQR